MIYLKQKLVLALGVLLLCLAPAQAALAVDVTGIAFKVAYTNDRYEVFMRPNATPDSPNLTLTSQVTLKVPHGVGADSFVVANLQNMVEGTEWTLSSRVNAPAEDRTADYLSFTVDFPEGNYRAYQWQAGQEIKLFSFENTGSCLGTTALLENSDPFMVPVNSAHTNPSNQIDVLGLAEGNVYLGNYGESASCGEIAAGPQQHLFMPIISR